MKKTILFLFACGLAILACVEPADAGVCATRGVTYSQPYVAPSYNNVTIVKEIVREILVPVAKYIATPVYGYQYGTYAAPPPPVVTPPAAPAPATKTETTTVASKDMELIMAAFTRIDANTQRLEKRIERLERIAAGASSPPVTAPTDTKPPVVAPPKAGAFTTPTELIIGRCARCHDKAVAAKLGKGFVLCDGKALIVLTDKQKLKIIARINSTKPEFQMPPPTSGIKLEDSEFDVLVNHCTN